MKIRSEDGFNYITYKRQKIVLWNEQYIFINFRDLYYEDLRQKMRELAKQTDLGIALVCKRHQYYIKYFDNYYMFNLNSQILLKRQEVRYA